MKITDVTLTMFKWEDLPSALPKKHFSATGQLEPNRTSDHKHRRGALMVMHF